MSSQKPNSDRRHTIAVLVDNEPGVLARVIGLFAGRGYNIESLTVSEVDAVKGYSRITIVTSGTDMVIEQIKALLDRLVPVHMVETSPFKALSGAELGLVKVVNAGENRIEALYSDMFRARAIDSTLNSFVLN